MRGKEKKAKQKARRQFTAPRSVRSAVLIPSAALGSLYATLKVLTTAYALGLQACTAAPGTPRPLQHSGSGRAARWAPELGLTTGGRSLRRFCPNPSLDGHGVWAPGGFPPDALRSGGGLLYPFRL